MIKKTIEAIAISKFKANCLAVLLKDEIAIVSRSLTLVSQYAADHFRAATVQVHELTLVTDDGRVTGMAEDSVLANQRRR